jgi:hypothetical protein
MNPAAPVTRNFAIVTNVISLRLTDCNVTASPNPAKEALIYESKIIIKIPIEPPIDLQKPPYLGNKTSQQDNPGE